MLGKLWELTHSKHTNVKLSNVLLGLSSLINLIDGNILPQTISSKINEIMKECINLADACLENKENEKLYDDEESDDDDEESDNDDNITNEELENKNIINNLVEKYEETENDDIEDDKTDDLKEIDELNILKTILERINKDNLNLYNQLMLSIGQENVNRLNNIFIR